MAPPACSDSPGVFLKGGDIAASSLFGDGAGGASGGGPCGGTTLGAGGESGRAPAGCGMPGAGGHRHLAGRPRAARGMLGGLLPGGGGDLRSSRCVCAWEGWGGALSPLLQQPRHRARGSAPPRRPWRLRKARQMVVHCAPPAPGFGHSGVLVLLGSCCLASSGPLALPAGDFCRSGLTAGGVSGTLEFTAPLKVSPNSLWLRTAEQLRVLLQRMGALSCPGSTPLSHPFVSPLSAGAGLSPRALPGGCLWAAG